MVDAEQTYLQRTIDSLTEQFQYKLTTSKKIIIFLLFHFFLIFSSSKYKRFNKQRPLIYNTMQNYLKATAGRIDYEIEKCRFLNMPMGKFKTK